MEFERFLNMFGECVQSLVWQRALLEHCSYVSLSPPLSAWGWAYVDRRRELRDVAELAYTRPSQHKDLKLENVMIDLPSPSRSGTPIQFVSTASTYASSDPEASLVSVQEGRRWSASTGGL